MVVPFMTLYLTQAKHYSIGKSGIVMAVVGMGAICGGILGGRFTDKFGFYNVQISALVTGGIMFLVLGQMESFPAICLCSFVLSVLNDAFRPANATAIAQYSSEENRTRSYSLNRLAINLGWAVGGAIGGFIASQTYHLLFWIDGLTNIGAALLLRAVLSPSKNKLTPHKRPPELKTRTNSAYHDKRYILFVILTILYACMFFQTFATLPVFYSQALYLTPFLIGLVMAVNGLIISLFEMTLIFSLESRKHIIHYITIGVLLVGASFVVFNILHGRLLLAMCSTIILTFGEMLSMPFMNTSYCSSSNPLATVSTASTPTRPRRTPPAGSCTHVANPSAKSGKSDRNRLAPKASPAHQSATAALVYQERSRTLIIGKAVWGWRRMNITSPIVAGTRIGAQVNSP